MSCIGSGKLMIVLGGMLGLSRGRELAEMLQTEETKRALH